MNICVHEYISNSGGHGNILILKFQMLVSMDIHWLIFLDSQFFPVFVFAPNSNILSPSDLSNWQKTKDYPPQMVLNFLILQRLLLLLLTLPCLWSFYFDKSWYLARDVTIKFFLPELFFCGGGVGYISAVYY